MAAVPLDNALLPDVREAQGSLLQAIFAHPSFDVEGERMYGKLFYVFEETIAVNDEIETAHLGEDPEGSIRAALEKSIIINSLVSEADDGGKLLKEARERYKAKLTTPDDIADVELGDELRKRAGVAKGAAEKALGR